MFFFQKFASGTEYIIEIDSENSFNNVINRENATFTEKILSKETMISIEELLSKNKTGQQICLIYKSINKLDEKLRNSLCDIIISYIENMSAR